MTSESTSFSFDRTHRTVENGMSKPELGVLPPHPQDIPSESKEAIPISGMLGDLVAGPPERVAALHLDRARDGGYTFRASPPLDIGPIQPSPIPPLNLIDHLGGGPTIKLRNEFLIKVYMQSDLGWQLQDWLAELYLKQKQEQKDQEQKDQEEQKQKKKEPWTIIIYDHLRVPFPWEFFAFNDPDDETGKKRHMGAEFRVARWQSLRSKKREDARQATDPLLRSKKVSGNVLAYFSNDIQARERPALDEIQAQILNDIHDFKAELLKDKAGLGLVYMGCHTIIGDKNNSLDWIKIGHMTDEEQQLRLSSLIYEVGGDVVLKLIQTSHPIVFLNACSTAYTRGPNDEIGEIKASFPEVFLQNGASGVVATLGLVDNEGFAPEIAKKIIYAVRDKKSIAEALYIARSEAFEAMGRGATHNQLKDLFNAFMYVYYGNPETKLDVGGG